MEELPDGRVLAAGMFRFTGSADTLHLVRLFANGTLDTSYTGPLSTSQQFGPFTPIIDIYSLDANRYIICGNFDHLSGTARGGIAMVDSSGALVSNVFDYAGCGPYTDQFQLIRQGATGIIQAPDGSFYLHGGYHGYDDGTSNDPEQRMVSRLYGLDVGVHEEGMQEHASMSIHPNPASEWAAVDYVLPCDTKDGLQIVEDITGREVVRHALTDARGQWVLDTRTWAPGVYSVQLRNSTFKQVKTLVVRP